MKYTIKQLEEKGFKKVLEDGNAVIMAKITDDGETLAHFICNKETGKSMFDFAHTISFDQLNILNRIAEELKK